MMTLHSRGVAVAVALSLPVAHATVVFAQSASDTSGGQGGGGQGGTLPNAGAGGDFSPTQTAPSPDLNTAPNPPTTGGAPPAGSAPYYPGMIAPTPHGKPLGGGNVTSSSSMPITGDQEDGFDMRPREGGAIVRGGTGGPVFTTGGRVRMAAGAVPEAHTVKKGDTLWDISDTYYRNPYQWPRLWSYNPQVQNPHWIYPGDEVRLRQPGGPGVPGAVTANGGPQTTAQGSNRLLDGRQRLPPSTVFLREQGFIDDDVAENWGELTGAREEKMFLTDFDEIYVRVGPNHDVRVGQELTIFRPVRKVGDGKLVQLQGTARVNEWNAKDRIARATIVESLDVIERGARVGPIPRRFDVVAPVRNEVDVQAKVLASVHHHNFYGENQVVFIDKGTDDGLKPGNRLFVIRRGDAWRRSLPSEAAATRIALESDSPAQIERVPRPRNEKDYPEEVIGELRVIAARPKSAACVVMQSLREIDPQEIAIARKGY